jgi:hypothetical protein
MMKVRMETAARVMIGRIKAIMDSPRDLTVTNKARAKFSTPQMASKKGKVTMTTEKRKETGNSQTRTREKANLKKVILTQERRIRRMDQAAALVNLLGAVEEHPGGLVTQLYNKRSLRVLGQVLWLAKFNWTLPGPQVVRGKASMSDRLVLKRIAVRPVRPRIFLKTNQMSQMELKRRSKSNLSPLPTRDQKMQFKMSMFPARIRRKIRRRKKKQRRLQSYLSSSRPQSSSSE